MEQISAHPPFSAQFAGGRIVFVRRAYLLSLASHAQNRKWQQV